MRFHHYDPYSQVFGKVVRGFARDLEDARAFVDAGMVDPLHLRTLVEELPDSAFARYPRLTPGAVREAVVDFVKACD